MEPQYIYLLQEREFVKTKENIFKIGKTKQSNNDRIRQYPKGSVLLFQMVCCNCDNIERELLKVFKEKYTHCKDIGNEYFDGDRKDMMRTIYEKIMSEMDVEEEVTENESICEESGKQDNSDNVITNVITNKIVNKDKPKLLQPNRRITKQPLSLYCSTCKKKFSSKQSIINHKRNIHNIANFGNNENVIDGITCSCCKKKFAFSQSRWVHEKKCIKKKEENEKFKLEQIEKEMEILEKDKKILELKNKLLQTKRLDIKTIESLQD
jgi:hypothetical protein